MSIINNINVSIFYHSLIDVSKLFFYVKNTSCCGSVKTNLKLEGFRRPRVNGVFRCHKLVGYFCFSHRVLSLNITTYPKIFNQSPLPSVDDYKVLVCVWSGL